MEISASEIDILSKRINDAVSGYTLSGAYSIEGGVLLRLRHETKQELLIAVASFATWITTKNLTLPQAEPFVSRIREVIERSRLVSVKQAGNERITEFSFESKANERNSLFGEFFAGGNLVLVDKDGVILHAEKAQRFRHRSIIPGEKYMLPPTRGTSLIELTKEWLGSLLEESRKESENLTAIKWFGRNVATSRKFVEEIFHRAGVKPDLPLTSVTKDELELLAKAARGLQESLESSTSGYLFLPKESGEDKGVDVCSIVPDRWNVLVRDGRATIQEFQTLGEALDEAQVQALVLEKRSRASKEVRGRAAELDSAISKQDSLLEKNKSNAANLRELATELMGTYSEKVEDALGTKLEALEVVERDETSGGRHRFLSEPRSFLSSFSTSNAIASRLFTEAKALEGRNRDISRVREDLSARKAALAEQSRVFEERVTKRIELERRAREWFERYRWFLTSDLRLAVGGRDSTSNSIVINKYTQSGEFVFHADLHGSPFFVLKEKQDTVKDLSPEVEMELAQATVSFSRAWKDELGSADAFWVRPDQVKKGAPSGEYLPRGSFFIEGKKNFVKHIRLELALGIMTSDKLPHEESPSEKQEAMIQPVIICGPEKALSGYCAATAKIAPGKEKGTAIARRVKQILVGRVKDEALKEAAKKLPIEEFIRVLPPGTHKLVSEKQNG